MHDASDDNMAHMSKEEACIGILCQYFLGIDHVRLDYNSHISSPDGNEQYRQYPFHGNPSLLEESPLGNRAIQYRCHDDAGATRNKEVFIYYQM